MTVTKYIAILFFSVFTSCKSKELKTDTGDQLTFDSSFYGVWEDNSTFMYSAHLTLMKDSTFDFQDRGCTAQRYSKGNWVFANNNLILNSFNSFDPSKIKISTVSNIKKENVINKKGYPVETYVLDTSVLNESINLTRDPRPIYFEEVKFRLEGDTLYKLDSQGLKTSSKFAMPNNYR